MSETCEHGEKGWCMSCYMDLVDNKREILITIDVLKKVVVKQSKKLRDLRAEYRTLVEAVRRKVSPVPCTCGMAGVSPCNRCSILLLLPQDSEEGGGE